MSQNTNKNRDFNGNIALSIKKPKKYMQNRRKSFKNDMENLIKIYIFVLRREGLSYGEIEKLSGISKAQVFRIENNYWFPKKLSKQQEILRKLSCFVEIEVKITKK